MSSQPSPPPPPNYGPIAAASEANAQVNLQIAQDQIQLGREQLQWAKDQFGTTNATTGEIIDKLLAASDKQMDLADAAAKSNADIQQQQLDIMKANQQFAIEDRARYKEQYQPLEDQLIQESQDYASPERKAYEMGRAQAAVGSSMQASRVNAQRDLEAYGVNPAALRFGAIDIGARAMEGAAKAGAGNQAGQMVDATGRALRSEALNIGRGYPGQIAGTYNTALQAGNGAVNTGNSSAAGYGPANGALTGAQGVMTSGYGAFGTATPFFNSANGASANATGALNAWGGALNNGYSNQMAYYNAQNNQSSGLGSVLGLATMFLADGGDVDGTPGGAIPVSASPTGGQAVDDVPAQLTAGEFVMPKQAVEWHGQKAMYNMIEKAHKERAEAKQRTGAIPQIRVAPVATQRPMGAIPMQRAA